MKFQVVEHYDGRETVLYTTDCEVDALQEREWQIDQWADQSVARKSVFVRKIAA